VTKRPDIDSMLGARRMYVVFMMTTMGLAILHDPLYSSLALGVHAVIWLVIIQAVSIDIRETRALIRKVSNDSPQTGR
jgi:hypothetical protein